jgi:hypothetical protein
VQVAEFATRDADISDVHVAVYLPGNHLRVCHFMLSEQVCRIHQIWEWCFVPECQNILLSESATLETLLYNFAKFLFNHRQKIFYPTKVVI